MSEHTFNSIVCIVSKLVASQNLEYKSSSCFQAKIISRFDEPESPTERTDWPCIIAVLAVSLTSTAASHPVMSPLVDCNFALTHKFVSSSKTADAHNEVPAEFLSPAKLTR